MSSEKKSLPSLSALARQNNSGSSGSLAQLKQKMQNQSTTKPLSPLQNLAQKSRNKPNVPSLASLAQRSTSKTSGLTHLATRSSAPKQTGLSKLAGSTPPDKHIPSKEEPKKEEPMQQVTVEEKEEEEEEDNPLCAKPSAVAQFLFEQQQQPEMNRKIEFLTSSLHAMFYESIKKSSPISVFAFDKPSPDDIVFAAQNQRGSKKN